MKKSWGCLGGGGYINSIISLLDILYSLFNLDRTRYTYGQVYNLNIHYTENKQSKIIFIFSNDTWICEVLMTINMIAEPIEPIKFNTREINAHQKHGCSWLDEHNMQYHDYDAGNHKTKDENTWKKQCSDQGSYHVPFI